MSQTDTKLSKICKNAIEIIESEGWIKNNFYREGEGYCLTAAIARASGDEIGWFVTTTLKLVERLPAPFLTLLSWNDAPERTKEEVIDFLRSFQHKLES